MTFQQPTTALLLLLLSAPTLAKVVESMSECDQFLLNRTPPRVPGILEGGRILNQNRYKPICQTFINKARFVTLYDVSNRIPVFSAFKYVRVKDRKRPNAKWRIEPQLENQNDNKNMIPQVRDRSYNHQAVTTDYRSNGTFDRGHIFASSYASTSEDKRSTFTLTNIVPQAESFNKGSWNKMERCIKCVMDKHCINRNGVTEGFGVTGAQPSFNETLNNRINIPTLLWSAFCCYNANTNAWMASAHWGDNVPGESKTKHLETKTLEELHHRLGTADSEFQVFPGTKCPLNTTVTKFYPEIPNCDCPPFIPTNPVILPTTSDSVTSTSVSITSDSVTSTSVSVTSTSVSITSDSVTSTSVSITSDSVTSTSVSVTSTSVSVTTTSVSITSDSVTSTSDSVTTSLLHYIYASLIVFTCCCLF